MTTFSARWNRQAARLLAAGLFVAVAGSAVLTAEAAPMDGGHRHGGGGGMMGGPITGGAMMGGLLSEHVLDAVNATTDQRSQIKQIMDATHADLRAQREAGRALHGQVRQLFSQPTVDARAAEALRLQLMSQHDQSSKRLMQTMLEVSRVLTPEQRARLADLAGQRRGMAERRAPPR